MIRRYAFVSRVIGLLIGFYLMCAVLIAGLIALDAVVFKWAASSQNADVRAPIAVVLFTAAAVYVVGMGILGSLRRPDRSVKGVEVHQADQPALWQHVRRLAAQVGTRAPSRVHLVPDVNAAVFEETRALGLFPGRRHMLVGIPLLMALTPAQLDAVLAHELGHYGNRDTRMGPLVGRVRASVLSALEAAVTTRIGRYSLPGGDLFAELFRGYAKLVLRVTLKESRLQEYAADRVAAQIAGPASMVAALERLRGIDAAFDFYLARYMAPGFEIGLRPQSTDMFGGFLLLLAEPCRQLEIEELRKAPDARKANPFDSHPPTPDRIAALRTLPGAGAPPPDTLPPGTLALDTLPPDGQQRAFAIVANPDGVLADLAAVTRNTAKGRPVTWDELAQGIGLHRANQRAKPLRDAMTRLVGRADLAQFAALVDAGRLDEVLDALPQSPAARQAKATGRVAREHAKTELAVALTGWLEAQLAHSGQLSWAHSWADAEGELRVAPALAAELAAAVAELTALRPDGTRLLSLVAGIGVAA